MGEHRARRAAELRDTIRLALRDLDILSKRADDARSRMTPDADCLTTYGAAALIHGYYTHLERVFERIARDLNSVPLEGPDWHRRLLRSMTLDRPGTRPPVLETALANELDEFLRFRHLFRNLYVLDLDPGRIALLVDRLHAVHAAVTSSLQHFADFLAQVESTT